VLMIYLESSKISRYDSRKTGSALWTRFGVSREKLV
jgi:hypothetical protein